MAVATDLIGADLYAPKKVEEVLTPPKIDIKLLSHLKSSLTNVHTFPFMAKKSDAHIAVLVLSTTVPDGIVPVAT